jgi:hypothetical protein
MWISAGLLPVLAGLVHQGRSMWFMAAAFSWIKGFYRWYLVDFSDNFAGLTTILAGMKINLAGLAGNLAEMTNNSAFLHFIPVVRNPTNATNPSNKKNSPTNKSRVHRAGDWPLSMYFI